VGGIGFRIFALEWEFSHTGQTQDSLDPTNLPDKVVERHDRSGDVKRWVKRICDEIRQTVLFIRKARPNTFPVCYRSRLHRNDVSLDAGSAGFSTLSQMILTLAASVVCTRLVFSGVRGLLAQYRSIPNEMSLSIVMLK
jgi:hypothetical protein